MRAFLLKALAICIVSGFFAGIVLLFATTSELAAMDDVATWPSRGAVVEVSRVRRVYARGKGHHWQAEVRCRPVEGGEPFWVGRIRLGDWCLGDCERTAREAMARYPAGKLVQVHFNPERERETVLEPDAPRGTMHGLRLLAAALVLLPLVLWLARKRPR